MSNSKLYYIFVIPHLNFPYTYSIDERLLLYSIIRCYNEVENYYSFAIKVSDIKLSTCATLKSLWIAHAKRRSATIAGIMQELYAFFFH